ncbi:MAG: helix-turn-helix transcriptional regulator [Spirochaetaceae bacterium]
MLNYYNIHTAGRSRVGSKWSKDLTALPVNRLYFIHSGEAQIITNDRIIELKKDNLYLLPSFSLIQSKCKSYLDHSYINFTINYDKDLYSFIDYSPILINSPESTYNLTNMFNNISANYTNSDLKSEMLVRGSIDILLSNFIEDSNEQCPIPLLNVKKYMEANLNKVLSINELSEIACYAPGYFSVIFKDYFDDPPLKYLNNLRIKRSQELLATTTLSIKEICSSVGIPDTQYFNKLFKSKCNIPPGTFRKKVLLELNTFQNVNHEDI